MVKSELNVEIGGKVDEHDDLSIAHKKPSNPLQKWLLVACVIAVVMLGVWLLQLLWNSPIVLGDQGPTTQSVVADTPIDSRTLPSEDGSLDELNELVIDTGVPLVSLLDEWPDIAGALILRGVGLIQTTEETAEVIDLTIVGSQINRWPSPAEHCVSSGVAVGRWTDSSFP